MDHFQAFMVRVLEWLIKNLRYILYGLAPIVGVLVVGLIWQYFAGRQSDQRMDILGKIEVGFNSERQVIDKQKEAFKKQADQLEEAAKKAAGIKAGDAAAVKFELDADTKAKKLALEKLATDLKPDHSKSLAAFIDFSKTYPKTVEGWNSALRAAAILSESQKIDEAIPLVQQIADAATKDMFYLTQSRLFLAGLFEEKGDYDKALAEIGAVESTASEDLKPSLLLSKGRLQLLKNAKEEARATFGIIIDKYASSNEAQKARSPKGLLN